MSNPRILIEPGRSKPLWYGHPWVFPKSIGKIEGNPAPGDVVEIIDGKNKNFIGYGFYNPHAFYQVRVLSRDITEKLDINFLKTRIRQALTCRKGLYQKDYHTAFRLINGEGDLLPGFTADLFNDTIIVKLTSLGYYQFKEELTKILVSETEKLTGEKINLVFNRLNGEELSEEGITTPAMFLHGNPDKEEMLIYQDGYRFTYRPLEIEKPGYYLDQRWNRLFLKNFTANFDKMKILDGYSYTGAFAHYLSKPGFTIHCVDSSGPALKAAKQNMSYNKIEAEVETFEEDTTRFLRTHFGYDLIINDPPNILKRKEHKNDAMKKYIHMNQSAALPIKSGGFLATSCSSEKLSLKDFEECVTEGIHQADREIKIFHKTVNAPDHPYLLAVPETGYLKFIFAQII